MSVAEKKSAKKIKLLDAAFELFTNKGINPTAVDEVVKRAGVAKGTFYLYFKDKYDLLDQIIIAKCEQIMDSVLSSLSEKIEDSQILPSDKIILILDGVMDELINNKNLAVLVLRDMAAFRKLWTIDTDNEKIEIYNKLLSIFIDGGCSEEEAPRRMYMTFISAAGVCCDSILYGAPYTPQDIRPQIHLMVKSLIK